MEENLIPETPLNKFFTANSIRVATFLGGPLVTGYLFAENYKQIGDSKKVRMSWLVSIASTVVLFVIAIVLPKNFPPYVIPIAYTIASYELAKQQFGEKIKKHLAEGGQTWPAGRAVVAGLIGFVILVAAILMFFFLTDSPH